MPMKAKVHVAPNNCQRTSKQDYQRALDRRRGSACERGYDYRWKKYRDVYLKTHPLCVMCLAERRIVPATVVDHIVPVNKGGDFWDAANHQALCASCHGVKTATEDGGFGHG